MKQYFTSKFFRENRKRLREAVGNEAPIVIAANGLMQRGGDSSYPFQQDGGFWYLTGIDEPDLVLVMDGADEFLIVPTRDFVHQAFDGTIVATELTGISGISNIYDEKAGWSRLKQLTRVNIMAPNAVKISLHNLYTNPARRVVHDRIKRSNKNVECIDVRPQVARLRMVKQAPEIAAIRQAVAVTAESMAAALSPETLAKYHYEYEIEAALSQGFRSRGARGHSFEPVIASGKNATMLHSPHNNGVLQANELIVIDVGAEYQHYDADITRTLAYGNPTPRQIAVYEAVLEVQDQAINRLKPGVLIRDNERLVEHDIGEKLLQLGLITKNDSASVRHYYPHACSHSLGLDPHDAADYSRPLAPGMVLTAEPGIYIPKEGIGVRIEDDILITETGCEVLSSNLSRALVLTD